MGESTLYSAESEMAVLGAVLIDTHAMDILVANGCHAEWFFFEAHRKVWRALLQLKDAGKALDLVTVVNNLRTDGELEGCGGVAFLESLVDTCQAVAHTENYMTIIREKKLLRDMIVVSDKIKRELVDGSNESAELIRSKYEQEIASLAMNAPKSRNVVQIARSKVQQWEYVSTSGQVIGLRTGMKWLDDAIGGMLPGSMLAISGPPGSSKTTLGRQICENILRMGAPAAVVTSEQSAEEYVGGMIAAEAGVPVSRLNVPGVSAHSLAMVKSAEKTVSGWNLDIEDAPMTRPQLISHFGRKISKGAKFALYDFAQDIMPSSNIEEASDEKRVSGLSVSFRWMLKKAGIPGILISSENYQSGMKYSRQIESDAWVWLQIQKADGYDPENYPAYKVTVKKARFAPNGLDQLLFWRNGRLLVETEWQASKARFTASSSNQAGSPTVRQAWAARNKEEEDAAEKARKSIAAITQPEFPAVEDSNDDDPFR